MTNDERVLFIMKKNDENKPEEVVEEKAADSSVEESSADLNATEAEDEIEGDEDGDDGAFPGIDTDSKRIRGWFFMRSYPYDSNDPNGLYYQKSVDEWVAGVSKEWDAIGNDAGTDWLHYIVHDEDIIVKGGKEQKKPVHMHGVIRFVDGKTQSAAMALLCGNNRRLNNMQPVDPKKGGYKSALLYLTHHTDSAYRESKTWYHHEKVVQIKGSYLEMIKSESKHRLTKKDIEVHVEELVDLISNGTMRLSDAKKKLKAKTSARTLLKYRKEFEAAAEEYREELIERTKSLDARGKFHKVTTYISGPGRSGKSLLADLLATYEHGYENVFKPATGGSDEITDDFVDGHFAEKATVFHDVEPHRYSKRNFFNMFDPNNWTMTRSRNYVKPWFSTSCYLAVNLPVGKFVIEMLGGKKKTFLPVNEDNAMDLVMGFGRIGRVVAYGEFNGQPVAWLARLKSADDQLTAEDLQAKWRLISPNFDSNVFDDFYDVIGYVPYDKKAPAFEERERMARVVSMAFNGMALKPDEYVSLQTATVATASPFVI